MRPSDAYRERSYQRLVEAGVPVRFAAFAMILDEGLQTHESVPE